MQQILDVEYIMGVAPGVLTKFWGYQQQDFCADLQQFSQKILDMAHCTPTQHQAGHAQGTHPLHLLYFKVFL